jgi:hypothetical protein
MKDKIHVVLILSVMLCVLILVFLLSAVLRPPSYGDHGHYRWDALGDVLSQKVAIKNSGTCTECHEAIDGLHEKDAHYSVPCVDCHGSNAVHADFHRKNPPPGITADQARMPKEYKLEGCLFCHRQLKARPTDFPQIDPKKHYTFLHVTDPATKCIACHNPHEPIFLLTEARKARLHPVVNKCTDCHANAPQQDPANVPNHPKIFQCVDCHASIVASFKQRAHFKYVECRTCHLFHLENERAGRMYKNGNAKFCLLCHEQAGFKDPAYPPKIAWPAHLGVVKYINSVDQKTCLHCHWNNIHEMNPSGSNPHTANWKTEHRRYLNTGFKGRLAAAKCGDCHAKNFCTDCHKVDIPHPAPFLENHKDTVRKLGMKTCQTCHKGGFCGTCHDLPK